MAPPPPVELRRPPDRPQNVRNDAVNQPIAANSHLDPHNARNLTEINVNSRNNPKSPTVTGHYSGDIPDGATTRFSSPSTGRVAAEISGHSNGAIVGEPLFIAGAGISTGENGESQRNIVRNDERNILIQKAPISSHLKASNLTLNATPPRVNSADSGAAAGIVQIAVSSGDAEHNKEGIAKTTEPPILIQPIATNLEIRVQPCPNSNTVVDDATVKDHTASNLNSKRDDNAGTSSSQNQVDKARIPAGSSVVPNKIGLLAGKDSSMIVAGHADTQPAGVSNTRQRQSTHPAFPKVSANFDKPAHKSSQHNQLEKSTKPDATTSAISYKNKLVSEPAPFTVVQTYATRLRANHIASEVPIQLVEPTLTTRQGLPAVIFDTEDVMVKLADRCKFTLIGKFTNPMPKMELIRKSFTQQTQLTGGVKIAHYNPRHVYIDLDNEQDYITVWTQQRMYIDSQLMRLQKWTPTFTPREETPIVPVWVTLPELPWHFYNKEFISALLSPVGKTLYLDTASIQKTRGSMAKVRLQINLTDELPPHIWIGFDKNDLTVGKWQAIQYEDIPAYCSYCKHQGHRVQACNVKKRDDEYRQKKEANLGVKSKDQHIPEASKQVPSKDRTAPASAITAPPCASGTKVDHQHQQQKQQIQPTEEWQIQKKKTFKGVTQNNQKTKAVASQVQVYKPTPSANQNIKLQKKQQSKQVKLPIEANKTTATAQNNQNCVQIVDNAKGRINETMSSLIEYQNVQPVGSLMGPCEVANCQNAEAVVAHVDSTNMDQNPQETCLDSGNAQVDCQVSTQMVSTTLGSKDQRKYPAEDARGQADGIADARTAEVFSGRVFAHHATGSELIAEKARVQPTQADDAQHAELENTHLNFVDNAHIAALTLGIRHPRQHRVHSVGSAPEIFYAQKNQNSVQIVDSQGRTIEVIDENAKRCIHSVQAIGPRMVQAEVVNTQNTECVIARDQGHHVAKQIAVDLNALAQVDAPGDQHVAAPAVIPGLTDQMQHQQEVLTGLVMGSQQARCSDTYSENARFQIAQAEGIQNVPQIASCTNEVLPGAQLQFFPTQTSGSTLAIRNPLHQQQRGSVMFTDSVQASRIHNGQNVSSRMVLATKPVALTGLRLTPQNQYQEAVAQGHQLGDVRCGIAAYQQDYQAVDQVQQHAQSADGSATDMMIDTAKITDARDTIQNQHDEVFAQGQQLGNVQQIAPPIDGSASAKMKPQNMGMEVFNGSKAADNSVFSSNSTSNSISVASRTTRVMQKTRPAKEPQVTHQNAQFQQHVQPAQCTLNTNPTSPPAEEDEYRVIESENENEMDTQSISDAAEEEYDNVQVPEHVEHTEVQQVADRQGLSPRGSKAKRHVRKQSKTSISADSSRPITTRSRSRGAQ